MWPGFDAASVDLEDSYYEEAKPKVVDVTAAFFGKDANFGRIISAIGQSGVAFEETKLKIYFKSKTGTICVFDGKPVVFDEEEAIKIMTEQEIQILVSLGVENKEATGWGCDLTYDYVKINASYRS